MKKRVIVIPVLCLIAFSFFVSAAVINSPEDGEWYNSRSVNFSLGSDDPENPSDFFYTKDANPRWSKLCSRVKLCEKLVRLKEGENKIAVKSLDLVENEVIYEDEMIVYVDSKKPIIKKTWPEKGFVEEGENFTIEFQEENLETVAILYGTNELEMKNNEILLDIDTDCEDEDRNTKKCTINLWNELSTYDGERIKYRFNIIDTAENSAVSRTYYLEVDQTLPYTEYFEDPIPSKQGSVAFILDITEENFKEVYYTDDNDERQTKKRMCNRLKDGRCYTKKRFSPGEYFLTIHVVDQAGNEELEYTDFLVY